MSVVEKPAPFAGAASVVEEPSEVFDFDYAKSWKVIGCVLNYYTDDHVTKYGLGQLQEAYERGKSTLRRYFPATGRFVIVAGHGKESEGDDYGDGGNSLLSQLASHYKAKYDVVRWDLYEKVHESDAAYRACQAWDSLFHWSLYGDYVRAALCELSYEEQQTGRLTVERVVTGKRYNKGTKVLRWMRARVAAIAITSTRYTAYPDLTDLIEKAFGIVADGWSAAVRTGDYTYYVVLSVNPLDILLASESTNGWESCHNLADGGCRAGQLEYLSCSYTAIQYAYRSCGPYAPASSLVLPHKAWRQWVYIDKTGAIQMRHYPGQSTQFAHDARKLVGGVLAAMNGIKRPYKVLTRSDDYPDLYKAGHLYLDDPDEHSAVVVSLARGGQRLLPEMPVFEDGIGGPAICVACGDTHTGDSEELLCCCTQVCCHCGNHVDDPRYAPDDEDEQHPLCVSCYVEEFAPCAGCGDIVSRDGNAYTCGGACWVYCPDCHEASTEDCEVCSDTVLAASIEELANGSRMCQFCYTWRTSTCSECRERFLSKDLDEDGRCEECHAKLEEEANNDDEQSRTATTAGTA